MNKNYLFGLFVFFLLVCSFSVSADLISDNQGYYAFDINSTSNQVTSSKGNNLTIVNAVWSNVGKIGAGSFNYSNSKSINGTLTQLASSNNAFSMIGWLYAKDTTDMSNGFGLNDFDISSFPSFQARWRGTSIQFLCSDSGGSYSYVSKTGLSANTWYHIAFVGNGTNDLKGYVNGVDVGAFNNANCLINEMTTNKIVIGGSSPTSFNGLIDEVSFYNRTLSQSEILASYNNGTGFNPFPTTLITFAINNITFISQVPSNLDSTSLFVNHLFNISYKYINDTTSLSLPKINYTLTGLPCIQYLNGSCIMQNNTMINISSSFASSWIANYTNITYSFNENNIYPYIQNLASFNSVHSIFSETNNQVIKTRFDGFNTSINAFYLFETMTNTSGNARIYVCNSSYTNGNIATNVNCQELGNINSTSFNHTHNSNSAHNIVAFNIQNGKINGIGITATSSMFFVIARTSGVVNSYYISNTTTLTTTETSINSGVSYSSKTYTQDSHIHLYPIANNLYLNYFATGVFNSTLITTSTTNELIELNIFPPNQPIITNPFNSTQSSQYINITYLNATTNYPNTNISYYQLSLLNNDLSFNRTIISNNSLNNSYLYDLYSQNLSLNTYYVKVCAFDTLNQNSCDSESFNLTRDSYINVTMFNNTNMLSNWSINVTDLTIGGSTITYNSTGNYSQINTIKNHTYNIFAIPPLDWAYDEVNKTINQTFNTQVFYTIATNSISITIRDEDTLALINQNTSIRLVKQGSALEYNYVSSNGTYFVYGIVAGVYDITFTSTFPLTYSVRTYTITINDRTTQLLGAFLVQGSFEAGFYIKSESGVALDGVSFDVKRLVNTTYVVVDSCITDILGYCVFTLKSGSEYYFTIGYSGYDTRAFLFTPYTINSPYTFVLKPSSTNPFFNLWDFVSYNYAPKSLTINQSINNFNFHTNSINGTLIYTYIRCDNESSISLISPMGVIVQVNIDTRNYTSDKVNCFYEFKYDSGIGNMSLITYNFTRGYFIQGIYSNGSSIANSIDEIKNDVNNTGWLSILSYFIIIIICGIVAQFTSGNPKVIGFSVCVLVALFAGLGWISPLIGGLVAFIGIALLFMRSN